jgi:periplasmic copper chaperone A
MCSKLLLGAASAALVLSIASRADAHASISSGPAAANKSQKITFSIGHGCEGADTIGVRVEIPAGITSVRGLRSDFGMPTFEKDVAGAVTAVSWRKPVAELQAEDLGYYELTIRARTPDAPFTRLQFNIDQTCRTTAGVETTVHWNEAPGGENEAPLLTVVPARQSGWNKYVLGATTTIPVADLPVYFADALIVWRGTEAYTPNSNTLALIQGTPGVSELASDLVATNEIWVKY